LLAKVPPEYRAELEALEAMSDEEPGEIGRSQMPAERQERLEQLLQKNQAEGLTVAEQQELDELHSEANRLLLWKSYAHLLLKWRRHKVSKETHP